MYSAAKLECILIYRKWPNKRPGRLLDGGGGGLGGGRLIKF